jgi:hypothetical protein
VPSRLRALLLGLGLTACVAPPSPYALKDRAGWLQGGVGFSQVEEATLAGKPAPYDTFPRLAETPTLFSAWQFELVGDRFHAGFELGGAFGVRRFRRYYQGDGSGGFDSVQAAFTNVDLFAGPWVGAEIGRGGRIYAGLAPALVYGTLERSAPGDLGYEVESQAWGHGLTFRAGIEFGLRSGSTMGLSFRTLDGEIDFGPAGLSEFDAWQVLFTASRSF